MRCCADIGTGNHAARMACLLPCTFTSACLQCIHCACRMRASCLLQQLATPLQVRAVQWDCLLPPHSSPFIGGKLICAFEFWHHNDHTRRACFVTSQTLMRTTLDPAMLGCRLLSMLAAWTHRMACQADPTLESECSASTCTSKCTLYLVMNGRWPCTVARRPHPCHAVHSCRVCTASWGSCTTLRRLAYHHLTLHALSCPHHHRGTLHLFAPGESITSTWRNGSYNTLTGTSAAAAHVAGAAALMWSYMPGATYAQIKRAILEGIDVVNGTAESISGVSRTALLFVSTSIVDSVRGMKRLPCPGALDH